MTTKNLVSTQVHVRPVGWYCVAPPTALRTWDTTRGRSVAWHDHRRHHDGGRQREAALAIAGRSPSGLSADRPSPLSCRHTCGHGEGAITS